MDIEKVKSNLCYYDKTNPDNTLDLSDLTEEELKVPQIKGEDFAHEGCCCDNCFYGRTKLATYILELLEEK